MKKHYYRTPDGRLIDSVSTIMQTRVRIFRLTSGNAVCALLRPDGTFRQVFMLWRDIR